MNKFSDLAREQAARDARHDCTVRRDAHTGAQLRTHKRCVLGMRGTPLPRTHTGSSACTPAAHRLRCATRPLKRNCAHLARVSNIKR